MKRKTKRERERRNFYGRKNEGEGGRKEISVRGFKDLGEYSRGIAGLAPSSSVFSFFRGKRLSAGVGVTLCFSRDKLGGRMGHLPDLTRLAISPHTYLSCLFSCAGAWRGGGRAPPRPLRHPGPGLPQPIPGTGADGARRHDAGHFGVAHRWASKSGATFLKIYFSSLHFVSPYCTNA